MAWRQYAFTMVFAVLAALAVRHFVLTAYKVPTGSMQPILKPGDFIFSLRTAYGLRIPIGGPVWEGRSPQRGDLVVFSYPHQPEVNYVKRVIALPGETIEMKKNQLIVNGKLFGYEEPHLEKISDNPNPALFDLFLERAPAELGSQEWTVILEKGSLDKNFGPLTVPEGEIFLLGDNRDTSDDSRYWGTVPVSQVSGRVLLIWLSLDWQKRWAEERFPSVRWERLFMRPH